MTKNATQPNVAEEVASLWTAVLVATEASPMRNRTSCETAAMLGEQGRVREGGVDTMGDSQWARPKGRQKRPKQDLGKRLPKPEGAEATGRLTDRMISLGRIRSAKLRRHKGVRSRLQSEE